MLLFANGQRSSVVSFVAGLKGRASKGKRQKYFKWSTMI